MARLREKGLALSELNLTPLAKDDVQQMVSEACHNTLEEAILLNQVVYEKTQGNPFFVHRFLH